MPHILVRHALPRTNEPEPRVPPFGSRNLGALSLGAAVAASPPDGFVDSALPIIGMSLAESIYLSGVFQPPALCSGLGTCGLCRVRFISPVPEPTARDREVLSHHDLDSGWRLACHVRPLQGMHVLVPLPSLPKTTAGEQSGPVRSRTGLAVDLGTTSLHWLAVDRESDQSPSGGQMVNPQMGAGSDVISRLACASSGEGAEALRRLTVAALDGIVRDGRERGMAVDEVCLAANPAMTAITLGLDTATLARAPYALPAYRGRPFRGGETVAVDGLPPVYIPPLISPFIGGDVSAGYASLTMDPDRPAPGFPFLLADIGTNGECLLALSPQEALAASVPTGPAMEGINLRFGMAAASGAVTGYQVTPLGLEPTVMGGGSATGIAATGYLSLLKGLRATGILSEEGLFVAGDGQTGLSRRMTCRDPESGPEPRVRLPGKMFLTASDVEEMLKAKAAFSLAVSSLLREAGLAWSGLQAVYLAGALGTHTPFSALTGLGFLPVGSEARIRAAGNTSLAGAALLLRHRTAREDIMAWSGKVKTLSLAGSADFATRYAEHMTFRWKT